MYALVFLFLFALVSAVACNTSLGVTSIEVQAQAIERGLICPVCPGETIDQSQVPLAKQMRAEVHQKLEAGWTKQQIFDYFAAPERYGPGVLAAPSQQGFNIVAWLVPPGVLAVGGLILFLVLRSMRKRKMVSAPATSQDANDPSLAPYLAMVEQKKQMGQPGQGKTVERHGR